MWHDIHASLIHLAIGQHEICSDELESISNTDLSSYQSSSSYDYFSNQGTIPVIQEILWKGSKIWPNIIN